MVLTDETDLFVFREEPLVDVEDEFGPSFFISLRNFDHNKTKLKPLHEDVLRNRVLDFIKPNVGFAEIYAMTDRSGTRKVNYKVAQSRLEEVQQFLLRVGAALPKFQHRFAKSIGEDLFEDRFNNEKSIVFADNRKDGSFRNVVIALTPAPIGVPTKRFRGRFFAETIAFCRVHQQKA